MACTAATGVIGVNGAVGVTFPLPGVDLGVLGDPLSRDRDDGVPRTDGLDGGDPLEPLIDRVGE